MIFIDAVSGVQIDQIGGDDSTVDRPFQKYCMKCLLQTNGLGTVKRFLAYTFLQQMRENSFDYQYTLVLCCFLLHIFIHRFNHCL